MDKLKDNLWFGIESMTRWMARRKAGKEGSRLINQRTITAHNIYFLNPKNQ